MQTKTIWANYRGKIGFSDGGGCPMNAEFFWKLISINMPIKLDFDYHISIVKRIRRW